VLNSKYGSAGYTGMYLSSKTLGFKYSGADYPIFNGYDDDSNYAFFRFVGSYSQGTLRLPSKSSAGACFFVVLYIYTTTSGHHLRIPAILTGNKDAGFSALTTDNSNNLNVSYFTRITYSAASRAFNFGSWISTPYYNAYIYEIG